MRMTDDIEVYLNAENEWNHAVDSYRIDAEIAACAHAQMDGVLDDGMDDYAVDVALSHQSLNPFFYSPSVAGDQ